LRDAVSTPDGGRIGIGSIFMESVAVKYKPNGDVEWAKEYNEFSHDIAFRRVIRTFDNEYLVFATDAWTVDHGGNSISIILKLDVNGNVLWSQNLDHLSRHWMLNPADVFQTNDGGFLLLMNSSYGSGPTYSYVLRYDRNLNKIWSKELKHFAAAPVYRSISTDGKSVYLACDFYDYYSYPYFGVDKLDYTTGNKIWTNRYNSSADNMLRINRIFTIGDTAYVFIKKFTPVNPFMSVLGTMLVKINPDGKINKANEIQTGSITPINAYDYIDAASPSVTKTGDNNFVISNQIIDGSTKALNITKVKPDGVAVWSRNYTNMGHYSVYNIRNHGNGFLIMGTANIPKPEKAWFTNGFLLKVDSLGLIDNNTQPDCMAQAMTATTRAVTITDHLPAIDSVVNNSEFFFKPATVLSSDIIIDATLYCNKPSVCSTATLGESGNSCSPNDTLTYFLQGGASCGSMAKWYFDSNFFTIVKETGDTLKLKPLKSGASDIRVEIEGNCFLNIQTKTVSVLMDASQINLGNDTLLCPGSTLTLNAHKGYDTYLWNNLSTDSIITVNAAGNYFVKVTDKCGGSYTDTILVTSAQSAFQVSDDTTKCNNDAVKLQATPGYTKYQWTPQTSLTVNNYNAVANPAQTTKYYASAEIYAGCRVTDSVLIRVLTSPNLNVQGDNEICSGDSSLIAVDGGFDSYQWNNGVGSSSIYVTNKGWYKVSANYSNGCISRDSFELKTVYSLPEPQLDKNPLLCVDESRPLDAGSYNSYLWNDGLNTRVKGVNATGTYWVQVTDSHGCVGYDTTVIKKIVRGPVDFLPVTIEKCQYGYEIISPFQSYQSYLWSDNSAGISLKVTSPGVYWLSVQDENNCIGRDSIIVIEKQCAMGVFVPNAFTPNRDGHNDDFKPVVMGEVDSYHFSVFNRWGLKVFETSSIEKAWDGYVNGKLSDGGTFVWYCTYTFVGQKPEMKKGFVQLTR
jgi:gliding motility-associated-like protein